MTAGAPALTALLDELDRLRAAATQGEWELITDHHPRGEVEHSVWGGTADDHGCYVAEDVNTPADAALIVAAVNAVPRLTAAVRAVLAVAAELKRMAPRTATGEAELLASDAADRLRAALTAALEATP